MEIFLEIDEFEDKEICISSLNNQQTVEWFNEEKKHIKNFNPNKYVKTIDIIKEINERIMSNSDVKYSKEHLMNELAWLVERLS